MLAQMAVAKLKQKFPDAKTPLDALAMARAEEYRLKRSATQAGFSGNGGAVGCKSGAAVQTSSPFVRP